MKNLDLNITNSFVFDFDSTIVTIETLDTIIKNKLDDEEIKKKIDDITKKSMNGEMDFNESITARIGAGELSANDFNEMSIKICDYIIPEISSVIEFLQTNNQKIFIVSGGFIEIVKPVAEKLGIPFENCFANDIVCDENDNIIGISENPLAYEGGKSNIIKQLKEKSKITGKVVMIGDGMSDYEAFASEQADFFIGCGFVISRPNVIANATYFANDPSELIDIIK